MKIAVWWNLPPGGARRALHDHLRGLAARGHEIHSFRPPVPQPDAMNPEEFAKSVTEIPLPDLNPEGRGYVGRVLAELRRVRRTVPEMERHSASAGGAIRAIQPDVVFANTCWLMAAPTIVRHIGSLPRVTYLQEPKRSLYDANPSLPWIEAPPGGSVPHRIRRRLDLKALAHQARIERENALDAGTLLVNSAFSRESVRHAYGLDSILCPLGIDLERFSPSDDRRERFVLGVGAIAPTKGVEAALLACRDANLPLVWVGPFEDDVYGPQMRALARTLHVSVEWRLGISDVELIQLYRRCQTLIATAHLEPFGYTPLEAAGCEAPVVAFREGGFRETVVDGETGLLADSPVELGGCLRRMDQDAALSRNLGRAAREHVAKKWSLSAAIDRLEAHLVAAPSRGRTI